MTLQLMNETSASVEARVMSATQKKRRGRPTDRDRLLQYRGNEMRNAEEEEEDGQEEEEEGEAAAALVQ